MGNGNKMDIEVQGEVRQNLGLLCYSLKQGLKERRDSIDNLHQTRLHRALSWLSAASEQIGLGNEDQAFINLWISFSACFYVEGDESIAPFIEKLITHDKKQKIYHCLWHEYSGSVKALIKNPYVFAEFWQAQRLAQHSLDSGVVEDSWRENFDRSSVEALNFLSRKQVANLFSIVLDRLYVLRSQVLQGGSTYQSRVNRDQVQDGVAMLASLMPTIIEIMLNASDEDWGETAYPVVMKPLTEG